MRVPFEWLREFVDIAASAEEVAGRLTMLGLEVEAVEEIDGDHVFEINVTPNRPDCLSINGIARELSAAYGVPLKFPEHDVAAESGALDFNVDILDTSLCRRYAGRIIKNLDIGPSPDWLKRRLEKCGIRAINNVVDITNYVLLELGHPLHAFDLKTIKGQRIKVGTPKSVKGRDMTVELKTLDGIEHRIQKDFLLIWDAKMPIAVAGIMGGIDTEVSDSTKDIFIESAYFDPVSVRRTSRALGIKTESSFRFERGADIKMLKKALDRAAFLMKKIAGGTIYGKIDIYPKSFAPAEIKIRYDRVNGVLGLKLSGKQITGCLSSLGFKVEEFNEHFKVKPPAYRTDISRDADIIEEVARTYGYDRIPVSLPKATVGIGGGDEAVKSYNERLSVTLKESFLKSGFTEVVNYSFMGLQDIELLGFGAEDERRRLVPIRNPLNIEDSYMRTTLVSAMLKNVLHNVSYGSRELRIFEMSKVFIGRQSFEAAQAPGDRLPEERNHIAAAYYKEKTKSFYRDGTLDFYIFKGVLEAVFCGLKIYDYSFVRSSEPFLHPGQSADIFIGNAKAGYIGAVSPEITAGLDIKAQKASFLVAEIYMNAVAPYAMQAIRYASLPRYPYIERDTAVVVDSSLESSMLVKWLKSYSSDLIEDISIFDVYQGGNIAEGKKSIAFNVRYRSSDRTLKDEEVDSLHQGLVEFIIDKAKGQLRQ